MKSSYPSLPFRKVLVPVVHGCDPARAIAGACAIAGCKNVLLAGIVGVKSSKSLSLAAGPARGVRNTLHAWGQRQGLRSREQVSASFHPWEALLEIAGEEDPDLLVLEWPCYLSALQASPAQALTYPPCDLVLVRPPVPEAPAHLLVPLRGGPSAELALRLSLAISDNQDARVTTLHVLPKDEIRVKDAPFKGLAKVLAPW